MHVTHWEERSYHHPCSLGWTVEAGGLEGLNQVFFHSTPCPFSTYLTCNLSSAYPLCLFALRFLRALFPPAFLAPAHAAPCATTALLPLPERGAGTLLRFSSALTLTSHHLTLLFPSHIPSHGVVFRMVFGAAHFLQHTPQALLLNSPAIVDLFYSNCCYLFVVDATSSRSAIVVVGMVW